MTSTGQGARTGRTGESAASTDWEAQVAPHSISAFKETASITGGCGHDLHEFL